MVKSVAFYDQSKRKVRVQSIRAKAKKLKLNPVGVKTPDPLDAIAVIISAKKEKAKKVPVLIGYLQDIHAPEELQITDDIWIECILCFMENESITFHPLDSKTGDQVDLESNVIRKYHRAFEHLTRSLKRRSGSIVKKYGRPPYGYHTVNGEMEVETVNAEAVSFIFQRLREGTSPFELINELRDKFKKVPGAKKNQFWDYVKLRRIIQKARLYCLGEYQAEGETVTLQKLAFLPPEWVDTVWPTTQTP